MLPRLRPAAATPKVRGGRRRPAAGGELARGEAAGASPGERLKRGEEVELELLPIGVFQVGALLVFNSAKYFGGDCKCAGRFRELCQRDQGSRLKIHITGTTHPDLLAYATGTPDRSGEVHVCPAECMGEPHSPGLVHARMVKFVKKEDEAKVDWELNLESSQVDELGALRRKKEELEEQLALEKSRDKEREKGKKRSRSRGKKKKKKKRSRDRESKSARSSSPKEAGERTPKKRRVYGGRSIAKKDLQKIYGGTGLDPNSKVRRKVMKYARRKIKKKASSSSTTGSSSGSRSSRSSEEAGDMLQDANRIRSLHRFGPGILTSMGVSEMREAIVELEDNWNTEVTSLPPITLKYIRGVILPKVSGGALREAMTLGSILDLMLMGRISEAADVGMQRLKAIERVSQGGSWNTTERLELIGSMNPQISTRGELAAAAKDLKLEQQTKGTAAAYKGKGHLQEGKGKKGKGEEKGKIKKGGEGDRGNREKKDR